MEQNPKYRHELKYLIDHTNAAIVQKRLETIMQVDVHAKNGRYKIRSLYFDDYWNTAYSEKMMGVQYRRKYRIRMYDDNDAVIKLECKQKDGQHIYKRSVALTKAETLQLIEGQYGFLLQKQHPLYHEFYMQCISRVLRPVVIVDYERIPFFCPAGDVRVTFDENVRACSMTHAFFTPSLPCTYLFDEGKMVMEVKYTEFMPSVIRNALPSKSKEYTAVSKFTGCFELSALYAAMSYNGVSQI